MASEQIVIRRVGAPTSRGPRTGPKTRTPFVIEVETAAGPGILTVAPQAAAVLAEELARYLKQHSGSG